MAIVTPDGELALPRRAARRAGVPQGREPAAHRLVQDPRRLQPALAADRRGAGPRASSPHPPATTRRASPSRRASSASPRRSSCRSASPCRSCRRPAATAPTSCCTVTSSTRPLQAAAEFAERTGAVLIPPFDHPDVVAGQGTLGARDPRAGAGRRERRRADRRRRADLRASRPRSRSSRPSSGAAVRVIGVQAENAAAYPPSLDGRAAGDDRDTADDRRRHRGRRDPAELNFAIIRDTVDEVVTVEDDDTARALVAAARARQARRRAGRCGRCRGGRSPARSRVDGPTVIAALAAATSTRWSWSASSAAASPPRTAT